MAADNEMASIPAGCFYTNSVNLPGCLVGTLLVYA